MVERPIKRSERQTVADAEPSKVIEEVLETEPTAIEGSLDVTPPPKERNIPRPSRGKDTTKGKGKGNQQEESRSSPMSAALMRGPKPTKPKPPVVKKTESETADDEAGDEADQDTTES